MREVFVGVCVFIIFFPRTTLFFGSLNGREFFLAVVVFDKILFAQYIYKSAITQVIHP